MRRDQDSLNPRTHSDIMVLSGDDTQPYWYARIIGIFHAMVLQTGQKTKCGEPKKMEFLFVRWFGIDDEEIGGWRTKKLHQIGFAEGDKAFGFIDPADIIRGVHLIPRFSLGRTNELLGPSFARSAAEDNEDWVRYYINMYVNDYYFFRFLLALTFLPRFVDRDMMMRFRGGGVGHSSTRAASDKFKNDRDDLDIISQLQTHPNTKEDDDIPVNEEDMNRENSDGERDMDEVVEEEDQLSDSELVDYGYELPVESSSDEEEGNDDRTTVGDGDY